MMPLGFLAASRHVSLEGWHMASAYNEFDGFGVVDLGPASPNRHVAIILRHRRTSPGGAAGAFNTVSIGGSPVAFTEVASTSAGRVVAGVAHVPANGLVTYTNEPHTGGRTEEFITIAAYHGEIVMGQTAGGSLWSNPISFSLNAVDGGVGLLAGELGGLVTPSNLEYFGSDEMKNYAGWEHTTAPTWSKTISRESNRVGAWCAVTLAPIGD